jgi:hypothetical protein
MYSLLFCIALLFSPEEVPYKATEDFEIKLQFEFKERVRPDASRVDLNQTAKDYERSHGSGPLPYLYLNVRLLKLYPEEVKMRVVKNGDKVVLNKKFDLSTLVKLDLGFTDDIKDRVSAYEYTILFLNENKEPASRIVIYFHEDGTYLVNGQVRGKL